MSTISSLNALLYNLTGQKSSATTVKESLKELINYLGAAEQIKNTGGTVSELLNIIAEVLPEKLKSGSPPEYEQPTERN